MTQTTRQITELLHAWADGDLDALDELMPLVFDDLHRMARFYFQRESGTHTLQATALVSELYFLLKKQRKISWTNRKAFFGFASQVMQHFLVDYARRQKAQKRGSAFEHVGLESIATITGRKNSVELIIDLNQALDELSKLDTIQFEVVRLRFFLGLRIDETAEVLEISAPTVKRKWNLAKLWLLRRLSTRDSETGEDKPRSRRSETDTDPKTKPN